MDSRIQSRTLRAAIGGMAMSMCLGGCMLSNPYVKAPTVDDAAGGCGDQCSISAAQQYSRSVRQAYRDRLGRYAALRNDSGAAEILLGATALGLAAGKANRDAFVTAGLAGATTYGLATWFGNSDLEALFASAIRALACAETAVEPPSLERYGNPRTGGRHENDSRGPA